jgi:hypothetical protein
MCSTIRRALNNRRRKDKRIQFYEVMAVSVFRNITKEGKIKRKSRPWRPIRL